MPSVKLPKPIFVDTPGKLRQAVQAMMAEPVVAVDTESNSLFAYHERVCLLQFSIPEQDFLVDPIVLDDLSPLEPLFSAPDIEKIFHAAEYDLIMLDQDFGFTFDNLFDTMAGARILGWKAVGLGSLLQTHFGIKVEKKYQRANWGKRPISPEMLTYAQLDTHYLIPLRNTIKAELERTGRWAIAEEDFRRACQVHAHQVRDGADCWHINGARELSPQQQAVLQEICRYRDQKARTLDRPLFKVISNGALLKIAETCPRSIRELESIQGISSRQARWLGNGMLRAVERGLRAEPPKLPRKPRPDDDFLQRVENLRQWRKRTAQTMGVESDVVLPKSLLHEIAETNPQNRGQLAEIMAPTPWRLEQYGDEILNVIQRNTAKPAWRRQHS